MSMHYSLEVWPNGWIHLTRGEALLALAVLPQHARKHTRGYMYYEVSHPNTGEVYTIHITTYPPIPGHYIERDNPMALRLGKGRIHKAVRAGKSVSTLTVAILRGRVTVGHVVGDPEAGYHVHSRNGIKPLEPEHTPAILQLHLSQME